MQFQYHSSNYRPRTLSDSCKHIIVIYAIFPEVWELETFHTAKVTFKVTEGHKLIGIGAIR